MPGIRVPVNIHIQANVDLMRVLNLALQANPGAVIEGAAEILRVVVTSPEGAAEAAPAPPKGSPDLETLMRHVEILAQDNVDLRNALEVFRSNRAAPPKPEGGGPPAEFCPP